MFMAHYPSEMVGKTGSIGIQMPLPNANALQFFSIVILMNAYARLDDAGLKTALLGKVLRMNIN